MDLELTLTQLGRKCSTDKFFHGFTNVYDSFLSSLRNTNVQLLEIGIYQGGSLKMWARYFEKGTIYGIDNECQYAIPEFNDKRIKTFLMDQLNLQQLSTLPEFNVIIDDGGHFMNQQQISFNYLFNNKLKPNGYYIIEDLHTSLSPLREACGGNEHNTTLKLLEDLQNKKISKDNQYFINELDFNVLLKNILSIEIFKVKETSITSLIKKIG
jgi:hypothetical protein